MQRLSKKDWVLAALDILRAKGAPALTIEALTTQQKVTKGSFYHHFENFAAFKTALLEFVEMEGTLQVIEQMPAGSGPERVHHLFNVASNHPDGMDTAFRAWALQDPEVRQVQERIDRRRLEYLAGLFMECGFDKNESEQMAKLSYSILIGSIQIQPTLPQSEIRAFLAAFQKMYGLEV